MSSSFDRRQHRIGEPRYFEDLAVGERFYIPSRFSTRTLRLRSFSIKPLSAARASASACFTICSPLDLPGNIHQRRRNARSL